MSDQILTHEFRDQEFYFNDTKDAPALIQEIFADNYKVLEKNIEFSPGDIILDIGANEGMFSIMMAKLYPHALVIALEPVPRTYYQLMQNIGLNGCANIDSYNIGVGKPGQKTTMLNVSKDFSGGSTSLCEYNPDHHDKTEVGLISLDETFELYGIDRCRLLKMDIEGSEYDVLYPSTILPKVDYMVIEIHHNHRLEFLGRRVDGLVTWLSNRTNLVYVQLCGMAE